MLVHMDKNLLIIIAIGACTTIYTLIDTVKEWNSAKRWKRIIVIVLCVAAVYVGYITYKSVQEDKTVANLTKLLFEVKDTSILNDFQVQIGTGGPVFDMAKTTIFGIPRTPLARMFRIYTLEGRLALQMVVRDGMGKPIAAIDGTDWDVYNTEDYEYNSDDNAFEIVTKGDRRVFFQIDYRNKIAHIAGAFFIKSRLGAYFYQNMNNGSIIFYPENYTFNIDEIGDVIPRIFKYPRRIYSKLEGIRQ